VMTSAPRACAFAYSSLCWSLLTHIVLISAIVKRQQLHWTSEYCGFHRNLLFAVITACLNQADNLYWTAIWKYIHIQVNIYLYVFITADNRYQIILFRYSPYIYMVYCSCLT
jgi:hypothetical protein